MLVVLAILSVGLLGFIIYLALSPKSTRFMKLASLIALGLIGLSLGICAIFLIIGPGEDDGGVPFPVFSDAPPTQPRQTNIIETLVFFAVFLLIMGLIVTLAIRDRRKKEALPKKKAEVKPALTETSATIDSEINDISDVTKKDVDEFDFELDLHDDN
jgi:amino acid transporter